jgi:PEP-CTERM motif
MRKSLMKVGSWDPCLTEQSHGQCWARAIGRFGFYDRNDSQGTTIRGTLLAILAVAFVVLVTSNFARADTIGATIQVSGGGTGSNLITSTGATDLFTLLGITSISNNTTLELKNSTGVTWSDLELTGTGITGLITDQSCANTGPGKPFNSCSISAAGTDAFTYSYFSGSLASGTDFEIKITGLGTGTITGLTLTPSLVPEPGTLALLGAGLLCIGLLIRGRRRQQCGQPTS